ncbi:SDR family NAD(P)-dependent oxidoreductase [Candidatus Pelagibacter sp.]|uniref:SDR family NAD(P)-dependent oxidoreductase n=1 Tax=Candidatus Pelagibacter sp. TaxID=2024849 RepID=UPI003F82E4D1
MQLKENEILIIGSEGSIGSSISKKLIQKKLNPILIDEKKLKKKNYHRVRLKDSAQIEKLFKKIFKLYPKIKILINCCGFIHSELSYNFLEKRIHNEKYLRKIFNENLFIPYLSSIIFAYKLFEKRSAGLVINFSSTNSKGQIGQAAYSASKKGIEILTKVWAKEFSNTQIRFSCVAPGYIKIKSTLNKTSKMQIKRIIDNNPTKRLGDIEELIKAIFFIIENDYFNGKTLFLDGGQ